MLKCKDGGLKTKNDKIFERRRGHKAEPYKTNEQPQDFINLTYKKEPWIPENGVRWALDQLPYNTAPACVIKQIELLNAIKDKIIPAITTLCNEVGGEGEIVMRVQGVSESA